jgi:hypothetical protein
VALGQVTDWIQGYSEEQGWSQETMLVMLGDYIERTDRYSFADFQAWLAEVIDFAADLRDEEE